jgi:hypothetical protein
MKTLEDILGTSETTEHPLMEMLTRPKEPSFLDKMMEALTASGTPCKDDQA